MTGAEIEAFFKGHSRFRVLQPFLGFAAGDELEITARNYDPHNSAWIWSLRSSTHTADLTELANDHLPVLRAIDRYLSPL